jgi:hypothetical protein
VLVTPVSLLSVYASLLHAFIRKIGCKVMLNPYLGLRKPFSLQIGFILWLIVWIIVAGVTKSFTVMILRPSPACMPFPVIVVLISAFKQSIQINFPVKRMVFVVDGLSMIMRIQSGQHTAPCGTAQRAYTVGMFEPDPFPCKTVKPWTLNPHPLHAVSIVNLMVI